MKKWFLFLCIFLSVKAYGQAVQELKYTEHYGGEVEELQRKHCRN